MESKIELEFEKSCDNLLKIIFRAKEPIECQEPLLELGEITVQNLCDALGDECFKAEEAAGLGLGTAAEKLSKARGRLVLVNGWQSWSFAGELKGRERPRRALLRRDLNLFVDHPAERALRQEAKRWQAKSPQAKRQEAKRWQAKGPQAKRQEAQFSQAQFPQAQRPQTLRHWARRFFHRHDIISHFLLGLRTGELRLMLVSDNVERWSGPRSTDVDRVSRVDFSSDSSDKSSCPHYL
ncbi:MAG: hypothetical protein ABFC21_03935, partial [Rectinema sp.]